MIYPVLYPSGSFGDSLVWFCNQHPGYSSYSINTSLPQAPLTKTIRDLNISKNIVGKLDIKGYGHHSLPIEWDNHLGKIVFPIIISFKPEHGEIFYKRMCWLYEQRLLLPNQLEDLDNRMKLDPSGNNLKTKLKGNNYFAEIERIQKIFPEVMLLDIVDLLLNKNYTVYKDLIKYIKTTEIFDWENKIDDIRRNSDIYRFFNYTTV